MLSKIVCAIFSEKTVLTFSVKDIIVKKKKLCFYGFHLVFTIPLPFVFGSKSIGKAKVSPLSHGEISPKDK